jgi:hypothetical protein
MQLRILNLALLGIIASVVCAEPCTQIHGRAVWYRGNGFFALWHIGTHHIFMPDGKSEELICQYFDCESGDRQPALFADFTVCPTEPFEDGAAQPATVKEVRNPLVIPDWPPPDSPREFLEGFLKWYVPRANAGKSDWKKTLKSMHWDLSARLARLLEDDAEAQARCNEIVGIDFDPILFTQDPAERYEVGAVERQGDAYRGKVYGVEHGQRSDGPDVIAVFSRANGHWLFLNLEYPSLKTDLISILKKPRPACTVPR